MLEALQRSIKILSLQNANVDEWNRCLEQLKNDFDHFLIAQDTEQIAIFDTNTRAIISSIEFILTEMVGKNRIPSEYESKLVDFCTKIHQIIFDASFSLYNITARPSSRGAGDEGSPMLATVPQTRGSLAGREITSEQLQENLKTHLFLIKNLHNKQQEWIKNKPYDKYDEQLYGFNIDFIYHVMSVLNESQNAFKELPSKLLIDFRKISLEIFSQNIAYQLKIKDLEKAKEQIEIFELFLLFIQKINESFTTFSTEVERKIAYFNHLHQLGIKTRKPVPEDIFSVSEPKSAVPLNSWVLSANLSKAYLNELRQCHEKVLSLYGDSPFIDNDFKVNLFDDSPSKTKTHKKVISRSKSKPVGYHEKSEDVQDSDVEDSNNFPLTYYRSIETGKEILIDDIAHIYDHEREEYVKSNTSSVKSDWQTVAKTQASNTNKPLPIQSVREAKIRLNAIWQMIKNENFLGGLNQLARFSEQNRNDDYYKAEERCLRGLGQHQKAIETLEKITKNDASIWYLFAYHYLKMEEYDKSLTYCEKITEADSEYKEILYIQMRCYEKKRQYEEKIQFLFKRLEKAPKDRDLLIDISYCHAHMGRFEKALDVLQSARVYHPKDSIVLFAFSHVYRATHEFDKALSMLDEISPEETDGKVVIQRVRLYLAMGDYDLAICVIKNNLPHYPESTYTLLFLYYRCLKLCSDAEVLKILQVISEKNPTDISILTNVAKCYRVIGQYDLAVALYQKMIENNPQATDAFIGLADCYLHMNRYDEGLAIYETLIQERPNHHRTLFALSNFYERAGQYTKALAILDKVPANKTALFNRFYVYKKMGMVDNALGVLDALKKMEPSNDLFLEKRAQYLSERGYQQQAIPAFKEIKGWEKDVRILLKITKCLSSAKQFKEALGYLEQAKVVSPKNTQVISNLQYVRRRLYLPTATNDLQSLSTTFQSKPHYALALHLMHCMDGHYKDTNSVMIQEIKECYGMLLNAFPHSEQLTCSYFNYMLAHEPEEEKLQQLLEKWPYLTAIHFAYAKHQSKLKSPHDGKVYLEEFTARFAYFTPGFLALIQYYLEHQFIHEAEHLKTVCNDRFHGNLGLLNDINQLFESSITYIRTSPVAMLYKTPQMLDEDFQQTLKMLSSKNEEHCKTLNFAGHQRVLSCIQMAEDAVTQDGQRALAYLLEAQKIIDTVKVELPSEFFLELNYKLGIAASLSNLLDQSVSSFNAAKINVMETTALDSSQKQAFSLYLSDNLSISLGLLQNYDQAIEAVDVSLDHPDSYAIRGYWHFQKGDYYNALQDFNTSLKLTSYTNIVSKTFDNNMEEYMSCIQQSIEKLDENELKPFNAPDLYECFVVLEKYKQANLFEKALVSDTAIHRFFSNKTNSKGESYLQMMSAKTNKP